MGRMGFVPPSGGGTPDGAWTLKKLLQGVEVLKADIPRDQPVRALITDSRRVVPGSIFFARSGQRTDGLLYAQEAIDRGAVAVVSMNRPGAVKNIAQIQVADPRIALAQMARKFYGFPDRDLKLIGITGTNGKTTVSWLLQHLLTSGGIKTGLIGTIHYDLGERTIPAYRTTPESVDSLSMLAQIRDGGGTAAVMEVSSHGLDQNRVNGFEFDVGVFLNLTSDHLDYHETMERYFDAKARLFDGRCGTAVPIGVINVADPWGRRLCEELGSREGCRPFGAGLPEERVAAEEPVFEADGTRFVLRIGSWRRAVKTRLAGRYNLANTIAAAAAADALELDPETIADGLESFTSVPGRMERVEFAGGPTVFVDYAHTDDALDNALSMLREIAGGRLLTVFGCGGDRDRSKREKMVAAVQRHSDLAWATADNPRSEALEQIFEDMRKGVTEAGRIRFVEDRRNAIAEALGFAREGDIVLVAGKGHEVYQEFKDTVIPFDDRAVVRELLELKRMGGHA
ncbi:MAG: UDP-N-acetylmuramoyl-L-alanyl-D-glutamate--2,6-diaminopimelate ligase [Puniceicoccaceae bacterium]